MLKATISASHANFARWLVLTVRLKSYRRQLRQRTVRKNRVLDDYIYDLGECMFCELCVNACPHEAIKFVNDFENSTFGRDKLVLHLDKEKFEPALPNIEDGGTPLEIGVFNTKIK